MSWFRRKPRNRRHGREHVLDVKLRADQVRAARLRLAAVALGFIFATVFGFYLLWRIGEWSLDRLVYDNSAFEIKEVDIQTDGAISLEQLRKWAGVKTGENLLALDLGRVKRDLEMVSVIRSVAVERVMPGTLRVRVSEREPLAQVYVPQLRTNGGYEMVVRHIDAEGCVMSLLPPASTASGTADTNQDFLPVITGLNPGLLLPGRSVDSPPARAALQLIAAFERSPMSGLVDLRRVDVSSPEVLQVATSQGNEITFAIQDMDQQLRRWREIYDLGLRSNKAIATLDLSITNNIPARWMEASATPPPVPRNKNPQRTRRRNV